MTDHDPALVEKSMRALRSSRAYQAGSAFGVPPDADEQYSEALATAVLDAVTPDLREQGRAEVRAAVEAVLDDSGGPDTWSHTFQGRHAVFADDVRAALIRSPPVVDECPDCTQRGRYDGRVLVGGRGVYTCPEGHRWQDADEKPTAKGTPVEAGEPL